jgi:hypothetical protein
VIQVMPQISRKSSVPDRWPWCIFCENIETIYLTNYYNYCIGDNARRKLPAAPATGSPFHAFDIAIPAGDLIGMIIAEEKGI